MIEVKEIESIFDKKFYEKLDIYLYFESFKIMLCFEFVLLDIII